MAEHDNGFLNSRFLRRCRKIGYTAPHDILPHYRRATNEPEAEFTNVSGLMLPYSFLSSSEKVMADQEVMREKGFEHVAMVDGGNRGGNADRRTLEILLEHDMKMRPFSQLYNENMQSLFFFSDYADAVRFRLTAQ
jgi:hypothetical protein